MKVNKLYIERVINDLNQWIQDNPGHEMMRIKKQRLSYYAMKAKEMDENHLKTVDV